MGELAKAKINLTLHVGPPRADGYHPLDSLVIFADYGDVLSMTPAKAWGLTLDGPQCAGLEVNQNNLVLKAAHWAAQKWGAVPAHFHLTKNLPVASGMGGGSANAAAALRLLARRDGVDISALTGTEQLGADVPVCLFSQTARMRGIGEQVELLDAAISWPAVLVNPGVAVSTAAIFKAYDAAAPQPLEPDDALKNGVKSTVLSGRNDLQDTAISLCPPIAEVLCLLSAQSGQWLTRMSGSGASCFALFETRGSAEKAAETIKAQKPHWWVQACTLGGSTE